MKQDEVQYRGTTYSSVICVEEQEPDWTKFLLF